MLQWRIFTFLVPTSIEQARNTSEAKLWEDAIQTDINSVYLNTFSELIIFPEGKKATKTKEKSTDTKPD